MELNDIMSRAAQTMCPAALPEQCALAVPSTVIRGIFSVWIGISKLAVLRPTIRTVEFSAK